MQTIAKFRSLEQALYFRDRCFGLNGESFMVVLLDSFIAVTTKEEAARLEKLGYEVM